MRHDRGKLNILTHSPQKADLLNGDVAYRREPTITTQVDIMLVPFCPGTIVEGPCSKLFAACTNRGAV